MKILPLALFIIPFLAGCGANNTPPQTPILGEKTSAKLRTLETGAAAIQSRPPVDAISTYLDGFHFYSGDKNGQMEAHHYVTVLKRRCHAGGDLRRQHEKRAPDGGGVHYQRTFI
ncbi:Putative outer membrane or secretedlipoprotein [Salmonella enterica subsp. enterica]|uniref:Outer membrane or secretedlipoprotein n=1 Tax=Salmonella enterica I TaxID=59201 RepID=A0A3S4ITZ2_SALET|nr:Putative outer membrane or secretedlipoprotein [Salmonella enterica subsp. enterica]